MLYRINRINRSVELNDELVNIYLKCDEIHEQIFSIVIRSKYGHAPTVDEVSDEELSALCNEILFSELKVLALLPNAIMTIYNNYEEYTENTYIELPIDDAFKIIAELVDSKAKLRASKNERVKLLETKLTQVPDPYYGFVVAVLTYVKKKESRLETVENYMISNPSALSSDILEFISNQDDFYEDVAYADKGI